MRTTLVAAVLLLLGSSVSIDAQRRGAGTGGGVTFAVNVTNPSGVPISDVRITLSGPSQRTTRSERGRAVFEGLPAGTYRIRFEKPGYVVFEREVIGHGTKPIDIKVALTPLAGPPIRPVGPLPPQQLSPKLVVLDMPAFVEKNKVARGGDKLTPLGCAMGGEGTLFQLSDPLTRHAHDDADEFIYVISGEGMATFGERQEPLGPNVFLMIPRHMSHEIAVGKKKPLVMMSVRAGQACGS